MKSVLGFELQWQEVIKALDTMNAGMADYERKGGQVSDHVKASFTSLSDTLLKLNDKQERANERLVQSIERQAAAYKRTEVERLVAQRDALIKKLGSETAMVDRVTKAYGDMIAKASEGTKQHIETVGSAVTSMAGKMVLAYASFEGLKKVKDFFTETTTYAARTEQLGQALEAVGNANKVSMGTIAATEQQLKKLGITTQDTRQVMAKLVAAHIDLSRAAELARASQNLGRVAGINSSEAFEKLTHAIVTQQPELMRFLGLNVNLQREFEMFARKTGRAAESLSELEKRQVTTNAALQAAGAYAGVYEKGLETAGGKMLSFKRYVDEAKNAIGNEFLPSLTLVVSGLEKLGKHGDGSVTVFRGLLHVINPLTAAIDELNQALKEFDRFKFENGGAEKFMKERLSAVPREKFNEGVQKMRQQAEEEINLQQSKLAEIAKKQKEAALKAEDRAKDYLQDAQSSGLGGVAKILADRQKLIREMSHIEVDGRRYEVKLSGAALSDINAGTQAKIRAENRKTEEELIAARGKLADMKLENEKTSMHQMEQLEIAVQKSRFDAEMSDMRTLEDARLQLRVENIRKTLKIEETLIDQQLERDVARYLREEKLKGTPKKYVDQQVETMRATAAERRLQAGWSANQQVAGVNQELINTRLERDTEYRRHTREYSSQTDIQELEQRRADLDRSKQLEMAYLDSVSAYTLKEKLGLEAKRLAIETDYRRRSEQAELSILDRQHRHELDLLDEEVRRTGISQEVAFAKRVEMERRYQDDRAKLAAEADSEIALNTARTLGEARKRQYDELHGQVKDHLHTLFTRPADFGKQLAGTVRDAALKPVENMLSTAITNMIGPMFGVGRPDGSVGNPLNVRVVGGGSGVPSLAASFGVPMGGGGASMIPGIGAPVGGGGFGLGGFSGAGDMMGMFGPGGTSGFAGPVSYGGGVGASSGGGWFSGISSIIGGRGGGWSNMLGGVGWKPSWMPGANGTTGTGISGYGTVMNSNGQIVNTVGGGWAPYSGFGGLGATGIGGLAGAGLAAGGTMLASHGLMGQNMGTWKGVGEGAAGGAMIGFAFGGPLGAAIGAAAGAGIGIGEKIFGVESKERQAIRLVKQLYSVDINVGMAKQIADLARQKYGGTVSVAVRDPEVRKMVELYAAGTGQQMPMSATAPRAGSLVESGGSLYQAPTYQYGNPYVQTSGLPTVAGMSTGSYPGTTNPTLMQVFVGGRGAGDFMAGNVFTPTFVQSRFQQAQSNSNGRLGNSAMIQQPGLIVG